MNKYFYIILIPFFFQCKEKRQFTPINTSINQNVKINDSLIDSSWIYKDIIEDSIPGISLNKAKSTLLQNKQVTEVIVAVIDNKFDINHQDLKDYIWTNPNEVLNYIDDDNDGYIDDIYGWNFIGNPEGENVIDANYEYVRYVRYYQGRFKNKTIDDIQEADKTIFLLYQKAKKKLESQLKSARKRLEHSNKLAVNYLNAREALHSYFPDYNYTLKILNQIDTINNGLAPHVKEIGEVIKWGETDEMIISTNKSYNNKLHKRLNIEFNERSLVGDNPYDITDTIYGNNKTFNHLKHYNHGTRVSSSIVDVFKQISKPQALKILPISTSPTGSHHDKDLALAIRYAVHKGAKVINLSFGKEFSLHREWVYDAIKYAESHNVLIVKASGNSSINLDTDNNHFPRDNDNYGEEVSDNFLSVGASTYKIDKQLRASFSNYGKNDVDVFAPGDNITTALPFNKYFENDGGTSLSSAITSGISALLFSYYPNLTASQVKHIIMDSGVEYTFPVKTPTRKDKDKMTPFNELSKSGKIVNAYNALIMADSISRKQ